MKQSTLKKVIFILFSICIVLTVSLVSLVCLNAQVFTPETKIFTVVTTDPNVPNAQKQLIEKRSLPIEESTKKLSVDELTSIFNKREKIKINLVSIKEYQEKIAEWKAINLQLKADIDQIKLLGLDPNS